MYILISHKAIPSINSHILPPFSLFKQLHSQSVPNFKTQLQFLHKIKQLTMGEQKEGANKEGEKTVVVDAPAGKKDDVKVIVVLKIDLHCEGCAKKIKRSIKHYQGVEDVKADCRANKLTVIGKVEPAKIKERLEQKTSKKVDIISPQPKMDSGDGGDKKPEQKPDIKPEEKIEEKKKEEEKKEENKKEEEVKPPPKESATVVLKIKLHCHSCIEKIRKIIHRIEGVDTVIFDGAKNLVTVKGTMDLNEITPYLRGKLKRNVEIIPPSKEDGTADKENAGAGDKKDKEIASGSEKKENKVSAGREAKGKETATGVTGATVVSASAVGEREKEVGGGDGGSGGSVSGGGGGGSKMEMNRMEYHGSSSYPPQPPMYWNDGHVYGQQYVMESQPPPMYPNQAYMNYGYMNQGYNVDPNQHHFHAPQMFSDENPNACSVM